MSLISKTQSQGLPILVILIIVGPYWLVFVPEIEARMGLIPQLVAGYGRSGTTALMSLILRSPGA